MYCRPTTYCSVIVCFLISSALGQSPPKENEGAAAQTSIHIRGQDYTPYEPEALEAYGLPVPNIPDEENAALVYLDAINSALELPEDVGDAYEQALAGTWPEGEAGEKLAGWLAKNKPSLDALRRASTMDAYYMPLFRGDGDSLLSALLPQLSTQRRLAKTLTVEAVYLMHQGETDAALDNCLAAQRMAAHVANGSTIIEGLVGYAISGLADNQMLAIADSGEVDPAVLKAAAAEMERIEGSFPTFEQLLEYERMFAASMVDDILDKPNFGAAENVGMPFLAAPLLATKDSNPCWQRFASSIKRLYLPDRAVKKHMKGYYDKLIEATRRDDGGVGLTVDESELFKQIPAWDVACKMLLPSLSRCYDISVRHESNFVRTRLTLAKEAYRQETGEAPSRLTQLVPEYIEKVPADPMTGYEFEYKPRPVTSSSSAAGNAAPDGLEMITHDNEAEYLAKRRAPAILNPRAAKWLRYTEEFCERHRFTDAQRAGAKTVLREMEGRAAKYEQVHGARLQQLVAAADADTDELNRSMEPLAEMFRELRDRLAEIPTAEQKAAAEEIEQSKRSR